MLAMAVESDRAPSLPRVDLVGAHEHREAAMAVGQPERYRCLALLVSSYRIL
jgi:hypothetical protein